MSNDYGILRLKLDLLLKDRGISKTRICKDLDIPRHNFNRYFRNEFQRIDAIFICKICTYLNCDVQDVIEYVPPGQKSLHES